MKAAPLSLLLLCFATMAHASDTSDPACTLKCRNGGICYMGTAEFGYASEMDEDDQIPFSHRDPTSQQYCSCPKGYAGVDCEIAFATCDVGQEECSNGAPCVNAQDDRGGLYRHCECDAVKTDFNAAYATHFCRQVATVYCLENAPSTNDIVGAGRNHFCTNGGRCKDIVDTSEAHPGCVCGEAWEGPHCEFYDSKVFTMDDSFSPSGGMKGIGKRNSNALIFSMIGFACVALGMGIYAARRTALGKDEHYPTLGAVEMTGEHGVGGLDDPRAANQYRTQQFSSGDLGGPVPVDAARFA